MINKGGLSFMRTRFFQKKKTDNEIKQKKRSTTNENPN